MRDGGEELGFEEDKGREEDGGGFYLLGIETG